MEKFFKVTIEDEKGKVIHQVKTDCIIAAINDVDKDAMASVLAMNCKGEVMLVAVAAIDMLKQEIFKKDPSLQLADIARRLFSDDKRDASSDFFEKLFK